MLSALTLLILCLTTRLSDRPANVIRTTLRRPLTDISSPNARGRERRFFVRDLAFLSKTL
jgi:hypothetical protein